MLKVYKDAKMFECDSDQVRRNITLVRTRKDGHSFIKRLELLEKLIEQRISNLPEKILKLEDHKGELSVFWIDAPDDNEKEFVNECWSKCHEYSVIHFLVKIEMQTIII